MLFHHLITLYYSYNYEEVEQICKYLLQKTKHRPTVGIICGSGLGGLADLLQDKNVIPYESIPNFPVSTGTVPKSN